jgi:hypothetical protein
MEQTFITYDECDKECICPLNNLLPKLDQINFVSYDRIDKDSKKCDAGVLVQNLANVFPNMVYTRNEYLPNVQQKADYALIENDVVSIKMNNTLPIKEKDSLLCRITNAAGSQPHYSTVMNATESSIEISKWPNYMPSDELFLHGTMVHDYCAVDKGQIGALGAACAKELYQMVKCQAETIAALQKQIDDITARLS